MSGRVRNKKALKPQGRDKSGKEAEQPQKSDELSARDSPQGNSI
jgi:hypothetical protein